MTSCWLWKLAIHLPPTLPSSSFSSSFSLSLIFFKNPSPNAVLSAGFRAPKQSARSLCVALSGAGITLTLRQHKHFIRSTIIFFVGKRISKKKINVLRASRSSGWCYGVTVLLASSHRQQGFSVLSLIVLKERTWKNMPSIAAILSIHNCLQWRKTLIINVFHMWEIRYWKRSVLSLLCILFIPFERKMCDWQWILSCCHRTAPVLFLHVVLRQADLLQWDYTRLIRMNGRQCLFLSADDWWILFFSFLPEIVYLIQVLSDNKMLPIPQFHRLCSHCIWKCTTSVFSFTLIGGAHVLLHSCRIQNVMQIWILKQMTQDEPAFAWKAQYRKTFMSAWHWRPLLKTYQLF